MRETKYGSDTKVEDGRGQLADNLVQEKLDLLEFDERKKISKKKKGKKREKGKKKVKDEQKDEQKRSLPYKTPTNLAPMIPRSLIAVTSIIQRQVREDGLRRHVFLEKFKKT